MSPPLELPHNIRPHQRGSILTCPPKVTPGCLPTPAPLQPALPACLPSREVGTSLLTECPSLAPPFILHHPLLLQADELQGGKTESAALPAASAEPLALGPPLPVPGAAGSLAPSGACLAPSGGLKVSLSGVEGPWRVVLPADAPGSLWTPGLEPQHPNATDVVTAERKVTTAHLAPGGQQTRQGSGGGAGGVREGTSLAGAGL